MDSFEMARRLGLLSGAHANVTKGLGMALGVGADAQRMLMHRMSLAAQDRQRQDALEERKQENARRDRERQQDREERRQEREADRESRERMFGAREERMAIPKPPKPPTESGQLREEKARLERERMGTALQGTDEEEKLRYSDPKKYAELQRKKAEEHRDEDRAGTRIYNEEKWGKHEAHRDVDRAAGRAARGASWQEHEAHRDEDRRRRRQEVEDYWSGEHARVAAERDADPQYQLRRKIAEERLQNIEETGTYKSPVEQWRDRRAAAESKAFAEMSPEDQHRALGFDPRRRLPQEELDQRHAAEAAHNEIIRGEPGIDINGEKYKQQFDARFKLRMHLLGYDPQEPSQDESEPSEDEASGAGDPEAEGAPGGGNDERSTKARDVLEAMSPQNVDASYPGNQGITGEMLRRNSVSRSVLDFAEEELEKGEKPVQDIIEHLNKGNVAAERGDYGEATTALLRGAGGVAAEGITVPFRAGLDAVSKVPGIGEPIAAGAARAIGLPFEAAHWTKEQVIRAYPEKFDQDTPEGRANLDAIGLTADALGFLGLAKGHSVLGRLRTPLIPEGTPEVPPMRSEVPPMRSEAPPHVPITERVQPYVAPPWAEQAREVGARRHYQGPLDEASPDVLQRLARSTEGKPVVRDAEQVAAALDAKLDAINEKLTVMEKQGLNRQNSEEYNSLYEQYMDVQRQQEREGGIGDQSLRIKRLNQEAISEASTRRPLPPEIVEGPAHDLDEQLAMDELEHQYNNKNRPEWMKNLPAPEEGVDDVLQELEKNGASPEEIQSWEDWKQEHAAKTGDYLPEEGAREAPVISDAAVQARRAALSGNLAHGVEAPPEADLDVLKWLNQLPGVIGTPQKSGPMMLGGTQGYVTGKAGGHEKMLREAAAAGEATTSFGRKASEGVNLNMLGFQDLYEMVKKLGKKETLARQDAMGRAYSMNDPKEVARRLVLERHIDQLPDAPAGAFGPSTKEWLTANLTNKPGRATEGGTIWDVFSPTFAGKWSVAPPGYGVPEMATLLREPEAKRLLQFNQDADALKPILDPLGKRNSPERIGAYLLETGMVDEQGNVTHVGHAAGMPEEKWVINPMVIDAVRKVDDYHSGVVANRLIKKSRIQTSQNTPGFMDFLWQNADELEDWRYAKGKNMLPHLDDPSASYDFVDALRGYLWTVGKKEHLQEPIEMIRSELLPRYAGKQREVADVLEAAALGKPMPVEKWISERLDSMNVSKGDRERASDAYRWTIDQMYANLIGGNVESAMFVGTMGNLNAISKLGFKNYGHGVLEVMKNWETTQEALREGGVVRIVPDELGIRTWMGSSTLGSAKSVRDAAIYSLHNLVVNGVRGATYVGAYREGAAEAARRGLQGDVADRFAKAWALKTSREVHGAGPALDDAPIFGDAGLKLLNMFGRPVAAQRHLVLDMARDAFGGREKMPLLRFLAGIGTITTALSAMVPDEKEQRKGNKGSPLWDTSRGLFGNRPAERFIGHMLPGAGIFTRGKIEESLPITEFSAAAVEAMRSGEMTSRQWKTVADVVNPVGGTEELERIRKKFGGKEKKHKMLQDLTPSTTPDVLAPFRRYR